LHKEAVGLGQGFIPQSLLNCAIARFVQRAEFTGEERHAAGPLEGRSAEAAPWSDLPDGAAWRGLFSGA
jgi:hypothetical protein